MLHGPCIEVDAITSVGVFFCYLPGHDHPLCWRLAWFASCTRLWTWRCSQTCLTTGLCTFCSTCVMHCQWLNTLCWMPSGSSQCCTHPGPPEHGYYCRDIYPNLTELQVWQHLQPIIKGPVTSQSHSRTPKDTAGPCPTWEIESGADQRPSLLRWPFQQAETPYGQGPDPEGTCNMP